MLHALLLFAEDQGGKANPDGAPSWSNFMLPVMLVLIGYFLDCDQSFRAASVFST